MLNCGGMIIILCTESLRITVRTLSLNVCTQEGRTFGDNRTDQKGGGIALIHGALAGLLLIPIKMCQ